MLFKVSAGAHNRISAPILLPVSGNPPENPLIITDDGMTLPAQSVPGGVHTIIPFLPIGAIRILELLDAGAVERLPASHPGVTLKQEGDSRVDVHMNGDYFSSCIYGPEVAKPHIGPVMGPYGESFTRLDPNASEHPHHRSIWFSHGDVNGVDTWNEDQGSTGYERQTSIPRIESGPVSGKLGAECLWTDFQGNPLMEDTREYIFHNTPRELRILDLNLTLKATHGRVVLGATKEAGPLGIRVAESMRGDAGGLLTNAYGAMMESECWGRRSPWADYSGDVGGHVLGIAAFDHPENPGYPSYWHIRDYGLMAMNNFFWAGPTILETGGILRYRFRLIFHKGTAKEAGIAEHFHTYANPPSIECLGGRNGTGEASL